MIACKNKALRGDESTRGTFFANAFPAPAN